ncbi:MAG: 1-phosphofructokinase family hexose kinase [Bacteroidetes bacterium]|nr:1-phosphofructokinase family hexose kinase [Bacteroidota bacterium]
MKVLTITMNPVIDKTTTAEMVMPHKKIRCQSPTYEPGGGGINVSRAIHKLGGSSVAWYIAGGKSGDLLNELLEQEGIEQRMFNSGKDIRENLLVYSKSTNENYRITMAGPEMEEENWKKILKELKNLSNTPEYIVASGSLPPGVPDNFYAQIAKISKDINSKMILDTSGEPLKLALDEGVYMIKPNLNELAFLLNKNDLTGMEIEEVAHQFIENGSCQLLTVSLGAKGAMLASRENLIEYFVPPVMPVRSSVGAGDSMIAGILVGLMKDFWGSQAVQYGVAAGTAATMTGGSKLCTKEDTDKIYDWVKTYRC